MIQNDENHINSSLTSSQLFPYLFPFLDTPTIHLCKLVNKDWNQQITKCYHSQELRLLSQLYSLAEETNKDELTPDEISKINRLLVDTSKAMVYLQKSSIYDPKAQYYLRELRAFNHPPDQLFYLFYAFISLADPLITAGKKFDRYSLSLWRELVNFGVEGKLKILQKNLNQPQFLLEINQNSIQKVENFFKEIVFQPAKLQYIYKNSHYLGFWVVLILRCAKSRLELTAKARNTFDNIHLNAPFEKQEELVQASREKEACNIWLLRKEYGQKIVDYEKRLEELAVRREKNNIELTVLEHTMQHLKIEMQEIQQGFKKQFLGKT